MMSFASWSHVAPSHHQCSSSHKSMAYHLHQAIQVTSRWLVHTTDILKNIQKLRTLTEKLRFDTAFFQARYLRRGATGVQPTGEGLGQEGVGPSPLGHIQILKFSDVFCFAFGRIVDISRMNFGW